MKVIGLTDELRGDAERQCAAGFRAWIVEAEQGTWGGWEELMRHYPTVRRMSGDEAHFSLRADGTGIRAMVFFEPQLLMLRGIAPPPTEPRTPHRHRISLPPLRTNTHRTERTYP